ncbi:hypothetical protein OXIME_000207 [Oxyplasma meridianum]|uniref:Uncharacterized protein n=1 Tax=Oxyplasma meridianum TaxID=3073602 RepID=A0AAX4NFR4_9ARCH
MKYDIERGMGYMGENVPEYFEEIIETHGIFRNFKSHAMYTIENNYILYCFSCIPIAHNGGIH